MARARRRSKKNVSLTHEARDRVLASALEHADLGILRLARVLKGQGIEASDSSIRSTLLKDNLHTRELRLSFLEDRHLREGVDLSDRQKRALEKFNPCLRERQMESHRPGALLILDIVNLGDFPKTGPTFLHAAIDPSCCLTFALIRKASDPAGAKILLDDHAIPFYRQHGIVVQSILNGPGMVFAADGEAEFQKFLETQGIAPCPPTQGTLPQKNGFIENFERTVRTEYLAGVFRSDDIQRIKDLQKDFAAWLARYNAETKLPGFPNMSRSPIAAFQTRKPPEVTAEKIDTKPAVAVEAPPPAVSLLSSSLHPWVEKPGERTPGREKWIFRAVNAALVCLLIYYGWTIASKLLETQRPETDHGPNASVQPEAGAEIGHARAAASSLDGYHAVWERNLFGVSKAVDASGRGKVSVATIPVAEKNVGLKLIGTVVASDPMQNYAVIDVNTTREQGIFRENEHVGKAVIRRILRNSIIIETDRGQRRRLAVEDGPAKVPPVQAASLLNPYETPSLPANLPENQEGTLTFDVSREAVAPLMESRRFIEETLMSQHLQDGEPDGLRLGAVAPGNPLARIGLRTGDVVKSLNDEEITRPEKAEELLQALALGGDFAILIERRGQMKTLNVNIK
ncbi:MAG: PDZ domain-containing protein [Deltaproteobacteria bacterium]|nr:PDZ domain-containing protein [Deltaproteobacteria bacterium]